MTALKHGIHNSCKNILLVQNPYQMDFTWGEGSIVPLFLHRMKPHSAICRVMLCIQVTIATWERKRGRVRKWTHVGILRGHLSKICSLFWFFQVPIFQFRINGVKIPIYFFSYIQRNKSTIKTTFMKIKNMCTISKTTQSEDSWFTYLDCWM